MGSLRGLDAFGRVGVLSYTDIRRCKDSDECGSHNHNVQRVSDRGVDLE